MRHGRGTGLGVAVPLWSLTARGRGPLFNGRDARTPQVYIAARAGAVVQRAGCRDQPSLDTRAGAGCFKRPR